METKEHCGVNDALGGGVFRCSRPLSPEGNGSYCAYHGKQDARNLDLQLTPKTWLKKWFIYLPKYIWHKIELFPQKVRNWWSTRKNPKCFIKDCKKKSVMQGKYDDPACLDHFWP